MFLHHYRQYKRFLRISEIKQQTIENQLKLAESALSAALLIKDDQRAVIECVFNSLHYLEKCSETNQQTIN